MLRALGLRRGQEPVRASSNGNHDSKAGLIVQEVHEFEIALKAMDYVLDDRSQQGIALLKDKNETISVLALGVIQFLEATLGFEPEVMKRASETLSQAEILSANSKAYNQKLGLRTSSIYPPGTEYSVTLAESTLLNALVMLLQENGVVESAKALLKLRKAYHTLDDMYKQIVRNEQLQKQRSSSNLAVPSFYAHKNESTTSVLTTDSVMSTASTFVDLPYALNEQQLNDKKLITDLEKVYKMRKSRIGGYHIGNEPIAKNLRKRERVLMEDDESAYEDAEEFIDAMEELEIVEPEDEDYDIEDSLTDGTEDTSTIDEFIHSGVNLCFGILQVVLSLIPPTIGKVLSVVGFKGSRENGLRMLWRASKERNIHGELALLGLLVFYDGPFQFTDVDFDVPVLNGNNSTLGSVKSSTELKADTRSIRSSNSSSPSDRLATAISGKRMLMEREASQGFGEPTLLHPGKKLEDVLLRARATFPNSALWLLQEGRMLSSKGELVQAVNLMDSLTRKIEMRQVEGLLTFDRAMILVFLHDYERAADQFVKLLEVNAWSHAVYTFFAGACYLEIYRMIKVGIRTDVENLDKYKKLAEEKFAKAPTLVPNKKGFMSKPMPFDKFLVRKLNKINKIAAERKISPVDAVGTSLIHELAYFWNGYNRMDETDLKLALKLLGYSGNPKQEFSLTDENGSSYGLIEETKEECMIRSFLQSIILRRLGNIETGMKMLDQNVLSHIIIENTGTSFKYHKLTNDPYLYPTCFYEKAIFVWKLHDMNGLKACKKWLQKAEIVGDGDYELSARTGMKIKAAGDRLEGL